MKKIPIIERANKIPKHAKWVHLQTVKWHKLHKRYISSGSALFARIKQSSWTEVHIDSGNY